MIPLVFIVLKKNSMLVCAAERVIREGSGNSKMLPFSKCAPNLICNINDLNLTIALEKYVEAFLTFNSINKDKQTLLAKSRARAIFSFSKFNFSRQCSIVAEVFEAAFFCISSSSMIGELSFINLNETFERANLHVTSNHNYHVYVKTNASGALDSPLKFAL